MEDSNLREDFSSPAFQVRRIRPLCQPSVLNGIAVCFLNFISASWRIKISDKQETILALCFAPSANLPPHQIPGHFFALRTAFRAGFAKMPAEAILRPPENSLRSHPLRTGLAKSPVESYRSNPLGHAFFNSSNSTKFSSFCKEKPHSPECGLRKLVENENCVCSGKFKSPECLSLDSFKLNQISPFMQIAQLR